MSKKVDLERYIMYLNPSVDADKETMKFLKPYVKPKRVGEILRKALWAYMHGDSALTEDAYRQTPVSYDEPVQVEDTDDSDTDSGDAASRIRRSFGMQ